MFLEVESAAGGQAAHIALPLQDLILSLDLFEADIRQPIAFALLDVFPRRIEHLKVGRAILARYARYPQQIIRRFLEVEIPQHVHYRLDLFFHCPIVDRLAARATGLDFVEEDVGVAVESLVRADGVGQHEDVVAIRVFEIIVDAFLFHQAADEIEIRLAILDAVFSFGVGARKPLDVVIAETPGFEDILDDLGNGHVLENIAFGGARKKPEPGDNGGAVGGRCVFALVGQLDQAADFPIEIPGLLVGNFEPDGGVLPHHFVQGNLAILADEFGLDLKHAAELLLKGKRAQGQHIVVQGGLDAQRPVFLFQCHGIVGPFLANITA